ncbi:MAG: UDP-N-acetylmuramoyl-L-alanine--D-glutamate ligase [Patescibacteria group bacterium]
MSRQKNKAKDAIKIAFLGFGLENRAVMNFFLKNKFDGEMTVCDRRDLKTLKAIMPPPPQIKYLLGKKYNQNLDNYNILFRSPGWPLFCPGIQKAVKSKKVFITSAMNLFFALCPTNNIIGVTGTKGKGTTSSLIYKILKKAGKKVYLGGNIGLAPFAFLPKLKKNDWVILELSSFQLEDLGYSPKIAVITNLFPEHLAPADPLNPNYHLSLKSYYKAKFNIARHQGTQDYLVFNKKFKDILDKEKGLKSKIKYFTSNKLPSRLAATYNQENIDAAVTVANILKIKPSFISQAVKDFHPLEHRLELLKEKNGIKYYDNSFATTPESTEMDLKSFKRSIILLAGGADKGANFSNLAQTIKKTVKFLILFPGAGTVRLKSALKKAKFPTQKIWEAANMSQAVKEANKQAKNGDIVLLSTACASFGLFKNYKDRGQQFKNYVKKFS